MSQPRLTGDSVRSYLRDIGRIPLLEHDEEILLGRKVQRLMEIKNIEQETEAKDLESLAGVLGIPIVITFPHIPELSELKLRKRWD